jgi:hypothetical protein
VLLQSDTEFVHELCSANFMEHKFSKITVIPFARKTNVLYYQYRLGISFILQIEYIKCVGVHIDCKLYFHHHVDFIFSTCNEIIRVIRTRTFSFPTIRRRSTDAVFRFGRI